MNSNPQQNFGTLDWIDQRRAGVYTAKRSHLLCCPLDSTSQGCAREGSSPRALNTKSAAKSATPDEVYLPSPSAQRPRHAPWPPGLHPCAKIQDAASNFLQVLVSSVTQVPGEAWNRKAACKSESITDSSSAPKRFPEGPGVVRASGRVSCKTGKAEQRQNVETSPGQQQLRQ